MKPKVDKLKPRSKVCQSLGYLRGTKDYYFYSEVSQKVFVNTNTRFLEDDYMMSNKSRSEVN